MRYFINFLLFFILLFLGSCGTWHYTNYGKPFDFLKSQRITKVNNSFPKENIVIQPSSHELSSQIQDYDKSIVVKSSKRVMNNEKKIHQDMVSEKKKVIPSYVDNSFSTQKKKDHTEINLVKKFIENKVTKKMADISNTTAYVDHQPIDFKNEDISDILLLLICLLFAPVAVWWVYELEKEFWIDVLLYLPMIATMNAALLIFPVAYAIYVCFFKKY